jgi:hypothetical protein
MEVMICECCGNVQELDEIETVKSYLGTAGDCPVYENIISPCSRCNGTFVEAVECKNCGNYTTEEDNHYGLCNLCVAEYSTEEIAFILGEKAPEKVSINSFVRYLFSENEINDILKNYIPQKFTPTELENMIKEFCGQEMIEYLAEYLKSL